LSRPASGGTTLHRDNPDDTRGANPGANPGAHSGASPGEVATRRRSIPRRKSWRAAGRNIPWRAVGFGALGGLALYAAFPPVGWWPIAIPAVTVITLACRGRGWRVGLLVGLTAGLAEFVPLIFWLHVVTPLAWLVLAVA
jgi:apolipoprotein N-acyltransferase